MEAGSAFLRSDGDEAGTPAEYKCFGKKLRSDQASVITHWVRYTTYVQEVHL